MKLNTFKTKNLTLVTFLGDKSMIIDGKKLSFSSGEALEEQLEYAVENACEGQEEATIVCEDTSLASTEDLMNCYGYHEALELAKDSFFKKSPSANDSKNPAREKPLFTSLIMDISDGLRDAIKDFGFDMETDEMFSAMMTNCCSASDFEAARFLMGDESWNAFCMDFMNEYLPMITSVIK